MQMLESCDSSVDGDCQTQAPWNGVGWRQAWGKQCSYSGHCQDTASWAGLEATPPPSNTDLMIVVTVVQTYTTFSFSSQVWSAFRDTPVTLSSYSFYFLLLSGFAS